QIKKHPHPMKAKAIGLFVGVLVSTLIAATANASDPDGQFAIKGAGVASCERFVTARKEQSPEYFLFGGWIEGFISAMNNYEPNTFDVLPWQSIDIFAAALSQVCEKQPEMPFYKAVGGLAQSFGKTRVSEFSKRLILGDESGVRSPIYEVVLKRVQAKLKEDGHYTSTVDGKFGPGTSGAIRKYQEANSLPVTGIPDQRTLVRMFINETQP
ncbi:MAG: peptidoglycan-binding protein, partial [Pseudomonadota bacterium]